MKEILSFSLGESPTKSLCYFWSLQEYYSGKSPDFFTSFYMSSEDQYIPRCISIDRRFPFTTVPSNDIPLLWEGEVENHIENTVPSTEYHRLISETLHSRNLISTGTLKYSVSEEIEDKLRFLSEGAEAAQGAHVFMDWEFTEEAQQIVGLLQEFYAKHPILLFSSTPAHTACSQLFLYDVSDFSELLHIPVPALPTNSESLALLALGTETISYSYRSISPLTVSTVLAPLFIHPRGNSSTLGMCFQHFPVCPSPEVSLTFERGRTTELIEVPPEFPCAVEFPFEASLQTGSHLVAYYSEFLIIPRSVYERDLINESTEYIRLLQDQFSTSR